MQKEDSGLQVASTPDYSLPEHNVPSDYPIPRGNLGHGQSPAPNYSSSAPSGPSEKQQQLPQPEHSPRQRVCGMHPALYGLVVALVTAIIVGAAVGGGLGSQIHKCSPASTNNSMNVTNSSSNATSTATVTVQASPAATTTGGLYVDYAVTSHVAIAALLKPCSGTDLPNLQAANGQIFKVTCTSGWIGGDIGTIWAYTYNDCIQACASINYRSHQTKACTYVQWSAYMANATAFGNCFLKNTSATSIGPVDGALGANLLGV